MTQVKEARHKASSNDKIERDLRLSLIAETDKLRTDIEQEILKGRETADLFSEGRNAMFHIRQDSEDDGIVYTITEDPQHPTRVTQTEWIARPHEVIATTTPIPGRAAMSTAGEIKPYTTPLNATGISLLRLMLSAATHPADPSLLRSF